MFEMKLPSIYWTPKYSCNTAEIGVNHQSINIVSLNSWKLCSSMGWMQTCLYMVKDIDSFILPVLIGISTRPINDRILNVWVLNASLWFFQVVAKCRELGRPDGIYHYISADMSNLTSTEIVIKVKGNYSLLCKGKLLCIAICYVKGNYSW